MKLLKTVSLSLLFVLMSFSSNVFAEDITTKITHIYTYVGQGLDGDVAVKISGSSSECPGGFFLAYTGLNSYMVSFLLSAYHAKSKVRLIGTPASWAGSSAIFCELDTVGFVP